MDQNELFSTDGRIDGMTYLKKWAYIKIPYWIIQTIAIVITVVTFGIAFPLIILVWAVHLALLLPQMAKRLHDLNQSGWLALVIFLPLPFVPTILFLVLVLMDGTVGPNQYGEDPKNRTSNQHYATQEDMEQYQPDTPQESDAIQEDMQQ
jgi:uncharacterized membrane protein YhaH (DUF805 family)